jgi:hypothetical protein
VAGEVAAGDVAAGAVVVVLVVVLVVTGANGWTPVVWTSTEAAQPINRTAAARATMAGRTALLPWLPPERPRLVMVVATIGAPLPDATRMAC